MKVRFINSGKDWFLSFTHRGVIYVFGLSDRYPDGSRGLHEDNLRAIELGRRAL